MAILFLEVYYFTLLFTQGCLAKFVEKKCLNCRKPVFDSYG